MIDWHVGQKVVCVCAGPGRFWAVTSGELIEGTVYTVRAVVLWDGHVGLRLDEIVCRLCFDGEECAFHSRRFRPAVSPQADISILTSILDRINKREVVDA